MTQPVRATGWPSAIKVLVNAVADHFVCHAATRFPEEVQQIVDSGAGIVRVARLGGSRDRVTDNARVSVDVIHADEGRAEDLAESIAVWLVDTSPIRGAGSMLDGVVVEVAPHEVPYTDPTVSQFSAVYVTSARRISAY